MIQLGISSDFYQDDGSSKFPQFDIDRLRNDERIALQVVPAADEYPEDSLSGCEILMTLRPRVTKRSLVGADKLKLIVRFGVGYDRIDVDALKQAGVSLAIAKTAVGRPVAVAELTLMLALLNNLTIKDSITRRGPEAWGERPAYHGRGLIGLNVASIGYGTIMREFVTITSAMGLNYLIHDPYVNKNSLATDRLAFVDLETALGEADVLLINCPMTPSTRGMIGAAELDRMKHGSFLVNTARGGIVDEQALADALISGQLAGAGIDVFETEPVPLDNPLLKTPNTIVAPHSLAWTDQLFKANGEESIANILAYVEGERSPGLVF